MCNLYCGRGSPAVKTARGGVVLEVRRLQKTDISSYQQKGTGTPQLSGWQISFFAASGKQNSRKLLHTLRERRTIRTRPVLCVPVTRHSTITARLKWCREHHNWTEQDWACVLFSDENLNPIENVYWDALGRQVAGRNYPPTNKNTLIRALTEEWDKWPQQLLDNVVQSMVRRVECLHHLPVDISRTDTFL
ncbi:hypothetical protein TNCV_435551 [Trichonephila clavipes]|nr:hypothetical protein TNCV_435551 [Trichonephila clavipes]